VGRTTRAVAAALFVSVIGTVLVLPLVGTEDRGPVLPGAEPSPSPTKTITRYLSPSPKYIPSAATLAKQIASGWPSCPVYLEVGDPGMIAAYHAGEVQISTLEGDVVATVPGRPPLQWSPSGRYLLTGDRRVYTRFGQPRERVRTRGPAWAWSPATDCLLSWGPSGLSIEIPGGLARVLVEVPVTDASLSPSLRYFALAIRRGAASRTQVVVLDFRRGDATAVRTGPAVRFAGWLGNRVVYWDAPGESVLADGVRLSSLSPTGERDRLPSEGLAHPDFFRPCGEGAVVVDGGGRETTSGKRLAFIDGRERVVADGFSYASPSCSPAGNFVAVVRSPDGGDASQRRLVLLDELGNLLRAMTVDEQFADEYPLWGPRGTGVLFVRRPLDGGSPQLWFIPEGGRARPLGIPVATPSEFFGHFDWGRVIDWSAI